MALSVFSLVDSSFLLLRGLGLGDLDRLLVGCVSDVVAVFDVALRICVWRGRLGMLGEYPFDSAS